MLIYGNWKNIELGRNLKMRDREQDLKRMRELFEPIDKAVMMCDNSEELLMMASCMMISAKEIYDNHLGIANRKKMFKDLS